MDESICRSDGCDAHPMTRGLCVVHYGRARRAGTLEAEALPSRRARRKVFNVDLDAGIADCPSHGARVRIRVRKRKGGTVYVACRKCDRKTRGRRGSDPLKPRKRSGYSVRWEKYGITNAEYQLRLEAQGHACLICREPMDRPMVDHCHTNGHVRGILCHYCNAGLGLFRDNPDALAQAAKYVRRYLKAAG